MASDPTDLNAEISDQPLFLRSILDNIPHMIFVKDANELRFIEWNKAGEELVGRKRQEMVGCTDLDLFPAEEATAYQTKDRQVLHEKKLHDIPEETINTWRGTRILHTKKIPIFGKDDEPLYLLGISEDITDLKENKAKVASRLEAAREAERRHIARELHDELGQLLTALKLDIGLLREKLPPELQPQAKSMNELLEQTIKTVRRLATSLRPHILDDLGLKAGLEWLARQSCKRQGISYRLHWGLKQEAVNDGAASAIFRICQEALNNVVRHAEASHVDIKLHKTRDKLSLSVQDNGKGFDNENKASSGLGLLGIQERISLLGGTLYLDTRLNSGTCLTASAPISRCLAIEKT